MSGTKLAGAVVVAIALGAAGRAAAVDLQNVLADYTITSWTQKDGLPANGIYALAQDADGYLWVGTASGLVRFDGIRFVRPPAFSSDELNRRSIRALHHAHDGSMWFGLGERGGVGHVEQGRLRLFGEADGLAPAPVSAIAEDQSGTLWIASDDGLFFKASTAMKWERPRGLAGPVYSVFVDRRGDVLAGGDAGVFRLDVHTRSFTMIEPSLVNERPVNEQLVTRQPRTIVEDDGDQLWVTDQVSGFRRVGDPPTSPDTTEWGRGYRLLFDRDRNFWVGTMGQGLWRVRRKPGAVSKVERATSLTGLPSDGVFVMIQDRDGNIWAGTSEGLSRLTPRRITQITNFGLVTGIDVTPAGDIWIGAIDELVKFSADTDSAAAHVPLRGARLHAIHVDEHGTLWAATDRGILRVSTGRVTGEPLVETASLHDVDSITSDTHGGVFVHDGKARRLLDIRGGRLSPVETPAAVQAGRIAMLYTDRERRIWVPYVDGRLLVIRPDGAQQIFTKADGLDVGVMRQIYEDDQHDLWVAGSDGLGRFVTSHFETIGRRSGSPLDNLTAIVTDDARGMWIGTGSGILHFAKREDLVAHSGATHDADYEAYDRSDGLGGLPLAWSNSRRVIRTADGRLWFVTSRGLTIVDPHSIQKPRQAGAVRIEGLTADDRVLEATQNLELPSKTSRVDIAYTRIELTTPLRTRFRYRLEGFDGDWIDADSRRQAFYTNLPPRRYRFRVMAANLDGDWTGPEAALEFAIKPRFYQTVWFLGVGVVVLGLAVASGWQLRLRQVRRQFSMLLGERARLSREVHDTLLQSLVGLALQFDALASDVEPSSATTKEQIVRMRKQVEEHIREARQSIQDLRSPTLERADLPTALRRAGEQTAVSAETQFDVTVVGDPVRYSRKIEEQLFRIGQEAVLNATRHAEAAHIHMTLDYGTDRVRLTVIDDGRGFDVGHVNGNGNGHYGLVSMRERAEDVGGRLDIHSRPGAGTEVVALIPVSPGAEA